jgi:hypothetical protein
MKISIRETSAVKNLLIIDPKSGVDYIVDFIGNAGALIDGQFTWLGDHYACDNDTYIWWHHVVADNQALADRINDLEQEHGPEKVCKVVHATGYAEVEDYASTVQQALDETFGCV